MPPGMLLQAVLFLFLLVVVSVWDIKNREIPDGLQAAIALLSLLHFSPWNLAGALTALPYLLVALAGKGDRRDRGRGHQAGGIHGDRARTAGQPDSIRPGAVSIYRLRVYLFLHKEA